MNRIRLHAHKFRMAAMSLAMLAAIFVTTAHPAQAQHAVYTSLYSWPYATHDWAPIGTLTLGQDGNFYGTSNFDVSNVFVISPSGTGENIIATAPDGGSECEWAEGFGGLYGGVLLGLDGNLYGTCNSWNYDGEGVYFKVNEGSFSPVYSFSNGQTNFLNPLVLGTDGNFYGTTSNGGSEGYGEVFKLTSSGTLTVLYNFQGIPGNDGEYPEGPLTLGTDGNFYGITNEGGTVDTDSGAGTFYRISPSGQYKLLYTFPPSNLGGFGLYPAAGVTEGTDGNYYGSTFTGGTYDEGTIFKITTAGKITYLHSFNPSTDNADAPYYPLTLGSDGNFYGVGDSYASGGYGAESLYQITSKGKYTDIYHGFGTPDNCENINTQGCLPSSPLFQHPSGVFYGLTQQGGPNGTGTFYSFSTGLKPFALLQLPLGTVGSTLGIWGTNLTTTESVSFGGTTAASFNAVSDTFMSVTVPSGALTGTVSVTTSSATLNSTMSFYIVPTMKSFSPTSGPVGTSVKIKGTGLTQATKVMFGGVAATSFTVNSDSQITAVVPSGAVTGKIEVITKGGSVKSPKSFTVN